MVSRPPATRPTAAPAPLIAATTSHGPVAGRPFGEVGGHQRQRSRGDQRPARPLEGPGRQQPRLGGGEAADKRGGREQQQPGHEDAAAAQQVAGSSAQQQQASEAEGIGGDDPLQAVAREPEGALNMRQSDVDDGGVEHHHELGGGDDHQRQAGAGRTRGSCGEHGALLGFSGPVQRTAARRSGPAEPLAANQRSSRTVRNVGPPVVTPKRTFQVESSAPTVAPKWRRPPAAAVPGVIYRPPPGPSRYPCRCLILDAGGLRTVSYHAWPWSRPDSSRAEALGARPAFAADGQDRTALWCRVAKKNSTQTAPSGDDRRRSGS